MWIVEAEWLSYSRVISITLYSRISKLQLHSIEITILEQRNHYPGATESLSWSNGITILE